MITRSEIGDPMFTVTQLATTLFQRSEIESPLAKKRRLWQKKFLHLQGNLAI